MAMPSRGATGDIRGVNLLMFSCGTESNLNPLRMLTRTLPTFTKIGLEVYVVATTNMNVKGTPAPTDDGRA